MTWVPALLLLLLQIAVHRQLRFLRANLFLFPAITVAAFLQALLATFTMLALSSLSKSSRYVGILYAGHHLLHRRRSTACCFAITGDSLAVVAVGRLEPRRSSVDAIFRLPPRYATPWPVSLIVVLALIAVSFSILERRVRGVEVVT